MAGNHDRCWHGHGHAHGPGGRAEEWTERYLKAGFDEIHQGVVKRRVAGVDLLMCHFPYRGDSHDNDRFVEHRPTDEGMWLLHGHVHERWDRNDRMINVGVDVRGYRPISEHEIAEIIAGTGAGSAAGTGTTASR